MKLIEAITMEDRFGPTRRNAPQLKHKIPFGLKDGALLHVLEVLNGKACGCVCPACSESLIAVNNVRKRIPHFRHSSGAECASGYETAIHMAAKDVLLRRLTLGLPEYSELLQLATSDNRHLQKNVYLPSKVITADRAYPEVSQAQGSFKPDVIFEVGDHQLFIEIRVTHAVDDEKKTKIRNHGVSVIEIDLSQLEPEMLQDRAAFDDVVCFDLLNRHWVFSQKIEQKRSKMMSQLREELEAYEEHLAEAIRLKVEEDKRAANRLKAEAAIRSNPQLSKTKPQAAGQG
ncbi:competence protein CoiA family protein [Pseudomonas sp. 2FG]|uniref:competence protein CoiA family protein n=1 Tax=Pseudomonas sp. 2FG TaxID=2502191 RepID=UPI0010F9789D|nr:competence protein CoiA family protein [Pseudomonas sp. 2FG]